jgi:hypothetical protein
MRVGIFGTTFGNPIKLLNYLFIICMTKIFRVLNMRSVFCMRDVYLDGKHMIRSCLDLVAITNDGSTVSDVDQLPDSPRNQKMTHAGMLVQCHQQIGTGSIMLMGYRTRTG